MDEVIQRIRRATEDLHAIEQELVRRAEQEPGSPALGQETLDAVKDFRAVIDQLRTFLWAYLEAATKRSGRGLEVTLQTARVERTTQMLQMLREQLSAPNSTPVPEVRSLFAEISAIAHTAYDQHLLDSPPQPPTGKK